MHKKSSKTTVIQVVASWLIMLTLWRPLLPCVGP